MPTEIELINADNNCGTMIRSYNISDYETIKQWWAAANEPAPPMGAMPIDSTFVYESSGRAVMSISVLLTNAPDVTFLENLISSPDFVGNERKQASQQLVDHACEYAKRRGYSNTICFCYRDGLRRRYQEFGLRPTIDGATVFTKRL